MVQIGILHYMYVSIIIVILVMMIYKKDIVLPCLMGIGIIGFIATGNILNSVQIIYKALVVSAREFIEIIVIISLISAMSKSLRDIRADEFMIKPMEKFMVSPTLSFFILGFVMLAASWLIWPTPAVAFIGTIMVPSALKSGLPAIWVAAALNLFGNGIALSSDFFIQAAPSITSKALGLNNPFYLIRSSILLWAVMSISTIISSFIMMKRDVKKSLQVSLEEHKEVKTIPVKMPAKIAAVITTLMFIIDIFLIYKFKLKGSEAASLIGGTAVIITIMVSIIKYNFKSALAEVAVSIKDGFIFGMKVFAPIIIIGAFFFLGSKETAVEILGTGPGSTGILSDIGLYLSKNFPLNRISVIAMQSFISVLLGVGGSGFSGLPLIGTLAQVFSSTVNINREELAALGQVITIWVGGGTIIPWSLVPIAAVCDVQPFELAKRNIIPVVIGITCTIIAAVIFL
ncbi:hypothetical protein HBE96_19095 [Clostridium sp. P21]|uniref:Transporter protein n=1 Tax=Clostridium muellerianum TaxID=2716538 RepID=A0A7Y0EJP0_9CLOT|nr:hypothetical protein [Clostridium muellerianum]NMM64718.1 hypothetical protein [Clostridium muellerianum]